MSCSSAILALTFYNYIITIPMVEEIIIMIATSTVVVDHSSHGGIVLAFMNKKGGVKMDIHLHFLSMKNPMIIVVLQVKQ